MTIINSYNAHILNLSIEVIFLVMRDVDCDRITKKLVDFLQGKALGLFSQSVLTKQMSKDVVPLERKSRPL